MISTGAKRLVLGLAAVLLLVAMIPTTASADRGAIPFRGVRYSEEAQNAIAAWNGKEEVLFLTTDIVADREGKILEMLPLPSVPVSISLGERTQFLAFLDGFNSKVAEADGAGARQATGARGKSFDPPVQILFQQSIGVHNLTVAKVNSTTRFAEWVGYFAQAHGVLDYWIRDEMVQGVKAHLARGIDCFVFDVLNVSPKVKSLDPIVYRFKTDRLYYPMAITAASFGNDGGRYPKVNLFLLVDGQIQMAGQKFFAMEQGRGFNERLDFNQSELDTVSPAIRSLFRHGARAAHLYTTEGRFVKDNWTHFEDVVIPKSQVRWSEPYTRLRPADEILEGSRGVFLTSLMPALLLSIVMISVLFRLRKQW